MHTCINAFACDNQIKNQPVQCKHASVQVLVEPSSKVKANTNSNQKVELIMLQQHKHICNVNNVCSNTYALYTMIAMTMSAIAHKPNNVFVHLNPKTSHANCLNSVEGADFVL